MLQSFKLLGILGYRGSRGGCRQRIPVKISNRRDEISHWSVDCCPVDGMARANLVPIARQVDPTPRDFFWFSKVMAVPARSNLKRT